MPLLRRSSPGPASSPLGSRKGPAMLRHMRQGQVQGQGLKVSFLGKKVPAVQGCPRLPARPQVRLGKCEVVTPAFVLKQRVPIS